MSRYYRQSDPRWRRDRLGLGKSTIGGAGCLLAACCILRELLAGEKTLPPELNRAAIADGTYRQGKSGAPPHKLAAAAGLEAHEADIRAVPTHAAQDLTAAVRWAIENGGAVILWVDHDSGKANGDAEGDHYVAGLRVDGDSVIYADPVNGRSDRMMLRTLSGVAVWRPEKTRGPDDPGERKLYQVTGVWPVFAKGKRPAGGLTRHLASLEK